MDDLKKQIEARIGGLRSGLAAKRGELAQLEEQVIAVKDQINATGGALQEAETVLKLIEAAPAPEDDYPKLGPSSSSYLSKNGMA